MSVFIINTFSAYLSIFFYLSIREGDLCHSAVVAGDLERRHKGEPSLRDRHYETVPDEPPPAAPSPGTEHRVPIPLRWDTAWMQPRCCCHYRDPSFNKVFQNRLLGRRDPGLYSTCKQLFGKGLEGPRVLSGCYGLAQSRDPPPPAHTVAGHHVPPHHQAAPVTPTQLCMLDREVWGRLSWSSAFFSAVRPMSGGKLHPARPQQPLVPPSQVLSTQSLG